MTARVILLNGPPGGGKTTVGRALASLFPNGACIHGDCLKHFVVSRVDGAVRGGLGYINGAAVAANFIEAGGGSADPIPLTIADVRRLLLRLTQAAEKRKQGRHWSRWRRRYQARARRGHYARWLRRHPP